MARPRVRSGTRARVAAGALIALACLVGGYPALAENARPAHHGLVPGEEGERRMLGALDRYRAVAKGGGWPALPGGPTLRTGDTGPGVAILRRRLTATGDLAPAEASPDAFGPTLDAAVRRFQFRHGLVVDGWSARGPGRRSTSASTRGSRRSPSTSNGRAERGGALPTGTS